MALMPTAFDNLQESNSAVQRVQSRFAQDVDHINYNLVN
jgi:hypothetical protein